MTLNINTQIYYASAIEALIDENLHVTLSPQETEVMSWRLGRWWMGERFTTKSM